MVDILDYILLKQENMMLRLKSLKDNYTQMEKEYKAIDKWVLDTDEKLHLLLSRIDENKI